MSDDLEIDYDGPYTDEWYVSVEARLGRLRMVAYADGAIALGAIALGVVTFKAMNNLMQGLNALGTITGGLQQAVFGNPAVSDVAVRPPAGTDETIIDEYPGPIAKPVQGPESEASERVKEAMASDPIDPGTLAKGPDFT